MPYLNQNLNAIPTYAVDLRGVPIDGVGRVPANVADSSLSGTIAASGGTTSIAFVNTARQEVINPSTATLWARWGGVPAVNGAGSFPIAPGGSFSTDRTAGTLQLLSTAASQSYTVNRYG